VRERAIGLARVRHVLLDPEVVDREVEVQRRAMQTGERSVAPWQPVRTW
jgi:hypothetical protein